MKQLKSFLFILSCVCFIGLILSGCERMAKGDADTEIEQMLSRNLTDYLREGEATRMISPIGKDILPLSSEEAEAEESADLLENTTETSEFEAERKEESLSNTTGQNRIFEDEANSSSELFVEKRTERESANGEENNREDSSRKVEQSSEIPTESVSSEEPETTEENGYFVDASRIAELVNIRRAENGLPPLSLDAGLCRAARIRSKEIADLFEHRRPDGRNVETVIADAGAGAARFGENIAAGYGSADSTMEGWMNSPGHRDNILESAYGRIGVAAYYDPNSPYGYYWTQIFAD